MRVLLVSILAAIVVAIAAIYGLNRNWQQTPDQATTSAAITSATNARYSHEDNSHILSVSARTPLLDESRGVLTLAPMLEQVTPAVVNIAVLLRSDADESPLLKEPFFRKFFGLPETGPLIPQERRARAAGSGVIVDAGKGLIVTNHHVVKDADSITVTLKNGQQLRAELVGTDAATEVALVRIPESKLISIPFADSDLVRVGDIVLAIGNPFGVGQTVTSGIISALGRSGFLPDKHEEFIQTDASINPGNSGGPLVNSKGDLVGINTAIFAPSGVSVGIGFAIPANIVKAVINQLETFGIVSPGKIGITVQSVTAEIASEAGLSQATGAMIRSVEGDSPGQRAGLKIGDVITDINGKPVLSASDLRNHVDLTQGSANVMITYLRSGRQNSVAVSIAPATLIIRRERHH
jgi:serine protease DegQ